MSSSLWQQPSGAGIASMTKLPPSPDLKAIAHNNNPPPEPLSLDGHEEKRPSSRLQSIARYQAFQPQALACSPPVASAYDPEGQQQKTASSNNNRMRGGSSSMLHERSTSSLGAVAGAQGVAIFRVSSPHSPLLVLSHSSNSVCRGQPITSLAFQPDSSRSLHLAAARGSGVLVWDVGGHSLSPLLGRFGVEATTSESDFITSVAWKPCATAACPSLLASTTSTSASLWDLRFSSSPKPCLRLGAPSSAATTGNHPRSSRAAAAVSYVQVACSRTEECATLDTSGMVQVFDIRMTERPRSSGGALATFCALQHAGVGISHLPLDGGQHTSWLTWGLDSPNEDAVVKIWSSTTPATTAVNKGPGEVVSHDDYWFMDGSADNQSGNSSSQQHSPAFRLIARCSTPGYHLACARVCPDPVENSFVTVSLRDDNNLDSTSNKIGSNDGGWRADLWKLELTTTADNNNKEESSRSETFGLEKIVSFKEEPNVCKFVSSTIGIPRGLGRLCAAELVISSHSRSLPILKSGDEKEKSSTGGTANAEDEEDAGVVLCCLSDNGYVTTRVIPEALPPSRKQPVDLNTAVSPIRQAPRNHVVTHQAKVYPEDNDGAMNDAARMWMSRGNHRGPPGNHHRHHGHVEGQASVAEFREIRNPLSSSPPHNKVNDPQEPASVVVDGHTISMSLFGMDVPVPAVAFNDGMGAVGAEENNHQAGDIRDIAAMMENIETDRIPCPRICGATFGPGVGGLAMFNNGGVKKMWFWYERADSSRLSGGLPGVITEPTSTGIQTTIHASCLSANEEESTKKIRRDCPRTLQDLINMTAAAKEAQWWGERNESDASSANEVESAGDNFFDYFSECSQSSGSSEEQPTAGFMDAMEAETKNQKHGMYDNYFDNFQRPAAPEPPSTSAEKPDSESDQHSHSIGRSGTRQHPGPSFEASYDMLAPLVRVTHDFDQLALNGQTPRLAEAFELGRWDSEVVIETNKDTTTTMLQDQGHVPWNSAADSRIIKGYNDIAWQSPATMSPSNRGFQSYSNFVSSSQRSSQMHRIRSDPVLSKSPPESVLRSVPNLDNDHSVHGGEYSVRPHMQESMVFLRKLFSHQQQQQQQEGKHSFPLLYSPPDSPMLPNSFSKYQASGMQSRTSNKTSPIKDNEGFREDGKEESSGLIRGGRGRVKRGFYSLEAPKNVISVREQEQFSKIRERCLQYARACEDLNETERSGVWNLLAQMVDNRLRDALEPFSYGYAGVCAGFGGVGGGNGGALGVNLVRNIFRYYESKGDVQMLATMVCILSGGKRKIRKYNGNRHNSRPASSSFSFLPEGQDEKYDIYIRRYADLLYGWRLLTIRAEFNKHLVHCIPSCEGDNNVTSSFLEDTDNKMRRPGIAFVFHCQKCGKEADLNTNVCRTCQDYTFRCSICENAVRGLFIVCDTCGHGGHVRCLTEWFQTQSECPTGCGCHCTFTAAALPSLNPISAGSELGPNLHTPIADPLAAVSGGALQPH